MSQPLVSICCITYNQESFIAQAIEGFLMQKTDFSIEIIIHDDASTDKTQQIIKKYADKYPNIIKPIFQNENQFSKGKLDILDECVFSLAKGKYIALCEGDDYWTNPLKLQKQVDFLETNPDYGMVYTNAKVYEQNSGKFRDGGIVHKKYQSFEDLLIKSNIPSLTILIRNSYVVKYQNEIKPELKKWLMSDYPLWLFTSKHSKIKYLDEITAVYRVLSESCSHSRSPRKNYDFLLSTYEIRMFYASKYHVNEQIIHSIINNHFKSSIYYGILISDLNFVKTCVNFLIKHKMNRELWLIRLLFILKRFNTPSTIVNRLIFYIWREKKFTFN